jgi:hypothetical protein
VEDRPHPLRALGEGRRVGAGLRDAVGEFNHGDFSPFALDRGVVVESIQRKPSALRWDGEGFEHDCPAFSPKHAWHFLRRLPDTD